MAYHLSWDLRSFQFVLWPMDTDLGWIAAQKALVSAFVGLSGLSLWLAHGDGIRWRPFWRRWAFLFGAAMLVTIATLLSYPDAFVYFGVLHALALFALLGLVFLRVPALLLTVLGAGMIALGAFVTHPAFDEKILSWLGFWVVPPYTNDLVPVFPWFGVFLIGMAMGKALASPVTHPLLAGPAPLGQAGGVFRFMGRHSLILYLVHQPILLGLLVPLDSVLQPATWHRAETFIGECRAELRDGRRQSGLLHPLLRLLARADRNRQSLGCHRRTCPDRRPEPPDQPDGSALHGHGENRNPLDLLAEPARRGLIGPLCPKNLVRVRSCRLPPFLRLLRLSVARTGPCSASA